MKQKYLIATLAAGMLVLAGCGGGNSASPQTNQPGLTCGPGTKASEDGRSCVVDPDHMSPADMAAVAAKLHAGIQAVNDTDSVVYDQNSSGVRLPRALINARAETGATADRVLVLDEETMVPVLHGWNGQRFHLDTPDNAGTYEAHVYSNNMPTQGDKFGQVGETATTGYQYDLDANGFYTGTGGTFTASLVASPSFDQEAGSKTFELPNGGNAMYVEILGSYHGVSGTYRCVPGGGTDCSAARAAFGFTLGGGTWTFKPSNPEDRVADRPASQDSIYSSFGWWLHKSEDDSTYTASAFAINRGAPTAADITNLNGRATYQGGAAGKYALSSGTGGTNDAGHFTARATLNATFTGGAGTVTGTIDQFMGADGQSRDWLVELKEGAIDSSTGGITRTADDDTVWTIGNTAAAAAGEWAGTLYENDDNGVPGYGTGTFHAQFGRDGNMIGGFGVNKQ